MSRAEKLEQMDQQVRVGATYGHLHVRALVSSEAYDDHVSRIWLVECSAPRNGEPCGRQEQVRSSRLRFDGWTCCAACRKQSRAKVRKERAAAAPAAPRKTQGRGVRLTPEAVAALQALIQENPRRPPQWVVHRYEALHGVKLTIPTIIRHREAVGLRAGENRKEWAREVRVLQAIEGLAKDLPRLDESERGEALERLAALLRSL